MKRRIQNRESATRVRNRKRTRAEELEDEVKILMQEKAELKVQNASLVAENNMLKHQVGVLEKIISKVNQEDIDNNDSIHNTSRTEPDSIINLITKGDDDLESVPPTKLTRVSPAHNFRKHVAMLGVFTLLLCVYGLLPRTETHTVRLFSNLFSRPLSNAWLKPQNTDAVPQDSPGSLKFGYGWISLSVEVLMMACYLAYFIYVSVSFYKYRALRRKAYDYTPL